MYMYVCNRLCADIPRSTLVLTSALAQLRPILYLLLDLMYFVMPLNYDYSGIGYFSHWPMDATGELSQELQHTKPVM